MKQIVFVIMIVATPNLVIAQYTTPGQKKAIRWSNNSEYKKLSEEDGSYLLFNIGVRKHDVVEYENLVFEDLSGILGVNYGITRSNLAYEIGLNFIYDDVAHVIYVPEIEHNFVVSRQINSLVVPLTVRYSIPIDASQRFRFGANFTANWLIMFLNNANQNGLGINVDDSEDGLISYTLEDERKPPFFFKAGVHGKLKILNSSYIILQAAHAFTFSPNRRLNIEWIGKGISGKTHLDSSISGFMVELGYVIPLNVLEAKFSNRRRD